MRQEFLGDKTTMNAEPVAFLFDPGRHKRFRIWSAIAAAPLVLGVLLLGPVVLAQKGEKFSEADVVKLLKGAVPPGRVAVLAKNRGISFQVTPDIEKLLREAGANDNLVETLKQVAPKPSAPLLVIHSTPGHAQVYIDDVPIGTTSPEGMLKLPTLTPGDHKVRLALEKFNDYEVVAKLVPGETTSLDAKLEAVAAVAAKPVTPSTKGPVVASAGGSKEKTFDGTVSDTQCTTKHDKGNDADVACVKVCVKNRNAKYVLVTKETLRKKVYQVKPQEMFASFAGRRVRVAGTRSGDVITAQSVEPR